MEKQSRAIENFTEMVMKVASDRLKRPLTVAEISRVEENIAAKSHILSHTPDHPPYAAMIQEAIQKLNKESGSSEESISDFIKNKYPDLPLHHSALLKLYLRKQCDKKEIIMNPNNHYALAYEPIICATIEAHDQPEENPIELREEEEKEVGDEGQFMSTNEGKTRGRGRGRGRGKKSMVISEEEKRTEEKIHVNEHESSRRGRGRGRGRGNKEKSKEVSTSDLILNLVRDKKSHETQQVRGRTRKSDEITQ